MSNYKLEVENTEKLKSDINSAFTEINTELKKNDNLIASDLFDVDKCIEELKKNRVKWGEGYSAPVELELVREGLYRGYINLESLSFKPSHVIAIADSGDNSCYIPIVYSKNRSIVQINEYYTRYSPPSLRRLNGIWDSTGNLERSFYIGVAEYTYKTQENLKNKPVEIFSNSKLSIFYDYSKNYEGGNSSHVRSIKHWIAFE